MRILNKDVVATGMVDIVVFTYVGYLALGRLPFIDSTRGVAVVGLVLGLTSQIIEGRSTFRHRRIALVGGVISLALGIGAASTQHDSFLALFMASIIGLWIAAAYVRGSDRAIA